jgi:hypothetical protein
LRQDLVVRGEAAFLLLREQHAAVRNYVELASSPRTDLGLVFRAPVDLSRETRGPLVVALSDGAVENFDVHQCTRSS